MKKKVLDILEIAPEKNINKLVANYDDAHAEIIIGSECPLAYSINGKKRRTRQSTVLNTEISYFKKKTKKNEETLKKKEVALKSKPSLHW